MPSALQGISEIPHICLEHGITHAVISSGSRNAPLILAFASNTDFKCYSIVDERSAGYYALGMAQQLKKPVVLVCTSGTAVANYAPALAEAYYLNVPLVVLTADRPPEWIDQNDGQTIRQFEIFRNYVKKSFQMPASTLEQSDLWYFRRSLNEAVGLSTIVSPGPVHINLPIKEPLYDPLPVVDLPIKPIHTISGEMEIDTDSWQQISTRWREAKKRLVICGFSNSNPKLQSVLNQMSSNHDVVVFAENLSNLVGDGFIDTPDRFMASLSTEQLEDFRPDLVVTIGGSIISKRLKKYLRQYSPQEHWHIDENDLFIDTFQSLNLNIRVKPEKFFSKIPKVGSSNIEYSQLVQNIKKQSKIRHDEFIKSADYSDLTAWSKVIDSLPSNINLHLANSTPVRYAQLFSTRDDITYFSNRGTSGIDGCISTAAGAAAVTDKQNVLLIGDLAFLYDSNGLWNTNLPNNLCIIVMDNGGGNIFRVIDSGPEVGKIQPFVEAPHQVKIKDICSSYSVNYLYANSLDSLGDALDQSFKPNSSAVVIHIETSGSTSAETYKQYFKYLNNK
ncbi:MAG: 2-succinyl-5-enolpyruvyl-6-hydroxy-3-cyclohexene-1-carboxylic-acid synthase [Tenuifilaceae bacterium]|jgi:2-succinyl-5-enolpyruvyl-6-hydroxy-3-cyclohexene-1-carboxylate synthase|nr:2-succinyl-5-enolpyruvyl-6-hydroxy-3-cyclohexene-1-carboxylic-acid synthase [Tenuifilaceae bacterium]